jgi:hypothetical protein
LVQAICVPFDFWKERKCAFEVMAISEHVPVKFEGRQSDQAKNELFLRTWLRVVLHMLIMGPTSQVPSFTDFIYTETFQQSLCIQTDPHQILD